MRDFCYVDKQGCEKRVDKIRSFDYAQDGSKDGEQSRTIEFGKKKSRIFEKQSEAIENEARNTIKNW